MAIETKIRFIGGLAFLFILYSLWMGQMKAKGLPGGYPNPVLALELVENGRDVDAINQAEHGKAAEFIRRNLYKDFGYIAIYVVFFCSLGLLLAKLNSDWGHSLSLYASGCVMIAGILDLIENRGMLKALSTPTGSATDSLANSIRYPSLAKWSLLFLFCSLIGFVFCRRTGWLLIPGFALLLAALFGFSGVLLNLLRPKFYWTLSASLLFMGLAVVWIALAFTFWPARVLSKFLPSS